MNNKIKRLSELKQIIADLKSRGRKIVFTNGCFDILHLGHIDYLRQAKLKGDILIVAVNSDSSVRAIKEKGRPIIGEKERAKVLAALESVDFVTIFEEKDPLTVIEALQPDVLVKGSDWKIKDVVGRDFVLSYGGEVITIPYLKGYSTKGIIKKIRDTSHFSKQSLSNLRNPRSNRRD